MEKIKIGIEIECVYNTNILELQEGSYHNGIKIPTMPKWEVQRDSSLSEYGEFGDWSKSVEIVGGVFVSKKHFFRELKKFYKLFSKNGKYELYQVLSFNTSCGSHTHFSIDNFLFKKSVIYEIFPEVREYFKELIKKSDIKSKGDIISQYSRSYSKLLDRYNFKRERTAEFNFLGETEIKKENKGIEWRSLNMTNIKTWKEFFEFWSIVFKCLNFLQKRATKYKKSIDYGMEEEFLKQIEEDLKPSKFEYDIKSPKRKRTYSKQNIKFYKIKDEVLKCVI